MGMVYDSGVSQEIEARCLFLLIKTFMGYFFNRLNTTSSSHQMQKKT